MLVSGIVGSDQGGFGVMSGFGFGRGRIPAGIAFHLLLTL
jgi:hypothetical protein